MRRLGKGLGFGVYGFDAFWHANTAQSYRGTSLKRACPPSAQSLVRRLAMSMIKVNPKSQTLNPKPQTLNPKPQTPNPKLQPPDPRLQPPTPTPRPLTPKPRTLIPKSGSLRDPGPLKRPRGTRLIPSLDSCLGYTRQRSAIFYVPAWISRGGTCAVQGYLAHKKPRPPLGPPLAPGHRATVGTKEEAVSYEQGLPAVVSVVAILRVESCPKP